MDCLKLLSSYFDYLSGKTGLQIGLKTDYFDQGLLTSEDLDILKSMSECVPYFTTDKYEINSYRKSVIIKMADKISEDHMDQLPMLKYFKKWLLQLSISNPPSSSSHMKANFMIETVAELRDGLIRK